MLPLEEVDLRLRKIGITDGGQLAAVTPHRLGEALGVDRLIFGRVEEFTYQNVGFAGRRSVRLGLTLVSASSGERLWEEAGAWQTGQISTGTDEAATSFLAGLAQQALETAFGVPLQHESRHAVRIAFRGFPRR